MSARPSSLILIVVIAVSAGTGGAARAGCSVPPAFAFAPEDGSALPLNPTIWVFVRDRSGQPRAPIDELTVTDLRGLPLRTVQTALGTEGPHRAIQLQIASAGGTVIVRGRAGNETATARYKVQRTPRDGGPGPATEIVAAKYVYGSGCPSANGFLLSIAPKAPAYRVEFEGHKWIVDKPGASGSPRHGTIVTGSVYCRDFTIPTNAPLALAVTPLHADGRAADTRSPFCVRTGPPERCRNLGNGVTVCAGAGVTCSTWDWEVSGAVKAQ
jgi:hypothetical protein